MSIHEVILKIKGFMADDRTFIALIICFVGVSSFGIGRMSAVGVTEKIPVKIGKMAIPDNQASVSESVVPLGGEVIASKNGSKYHFPWCSGAKSITESNKITFKTIEEAKRVGYEPALNCPGLE